MSDSNKISQMTFGDLRNELANCTDPIRKEIIRNLMYIRYKQHLYKKEKVQQIKKENRNKQIRKIKRRVKKELECKYKSKDSDISDILDLNDFVEPDVVVEQEQIQNQVPQYNRDKTNNNLMKRLSNDIDINKMKDENIYNKKNKDTKRDFVPPFANNLDEKYASFNDAFKSRLN
jgi:hypothetical protein